MKPKIFLWCVPTGTGSGIVHGSTPGGDVLGYALAEDGVCLASHLSSNEEFSKHDMGLTSDWKHDIYKKYYPDGYEVVWVNWTDDNPEFKEALKKNEGCTHKECDHDN